MTDKEMENIENGYQGKRFKIDDPMHPHKSEDVRAISYNHIKGTREPSLLVESIENTKFKFRVFDLTSLIPIE